VLEYIDFARKVALCLRLACSGEYALRVLAAGSPTRVHQLAPRPPRQTLIARFAAGARHWKVVTDTAGLSLTDWIAKISTDYHDYRIMSRGDVSNKVYASRYLQENGMHADCPFFVFQYTDSDLDSSVAPTQMYSYCYEQEPTGSGSQDLVDKAYHSSYAGASSRLGHRWGKAGAAVG
jgi:hypothetical protein